MAEEAGAAPAAGSGDAAGAQAGGATTSTGTAQSGAGTAAVSAAAAAQWFDGLDQDTRGFLDNKQWFGPDLAKADLGKSITEIVKSYRGMESIMGRNRLPVPKDPADEEGWNQVYSALGRPASWNAYEFKAGEGGDQKVADSYAQIAHKHGLSTRQMQGMAGDWQALVTEINAAKTAEAEQTFLNTSKSDFEGLTREWGHDADHRMAAAQRAGKAFGLDAEKMNKLERALGTRDFLTLMSEVGSSITEDRGVGAGAGGGNGYPTTVAGATARMAEMKADKVWMEKYLAGGAEQVKEWQHCEQIKANALAA